MCRVYINNSVCQQRLGEHWHGMTSIVPLELCVCVYQEVESVHFGLVMFAEGQSGLVPKTRQCSQPDLGKYAIHTCGRTHILAQKNTHTRTHRVKHIMHMMQTNKHESRFSFPLSLFVFLSHTHTHTHKSTRFPTENHHLSWLRNRLPIHLSVHFSREWPCAWKKSE